MNINSSGENLYGFAQVKFSFLTGLGFSMNAGAEKTTLSSNNFKYILSKERYGEPPSERLFSALNGQEVISPYVALQYYLEDYSKEWRNLAEEFMELPAEFRLIQTEVALLLKYSWIMTSSEWIEDLQLLNAVAERNAWIEQRIAAGGFPDSGEVVNFLRLKRGH